MDNITIFGSGKMGSAIGAIFAGGGARVTHVSSSTPHTSLDGDIVVLAVPYAAIDDIIVEYGDQLAGKVVVDITNPINFQTFDLIPAAESSAAAELAEALPQSRVVKAFNTTFAPTLATPAAGAVVLVAGDDDGAKSAVIDAVHAGGFAAVDAGGLAAARELEAYAKLQIQLAMNGRIGRFAVVPAA